MQKKEIDVTTERKKGELLALDFLNFFIHEISNPVHSLIFSMSLISTGKAKFDTVDRNSPTSAESIIFELERIVGLVADSRRFISSNSLDLLSQTNGQSSAIEVAMKVSSELSYLANKRGVRIEVDTRGLNNSRGHVLIDRLRLAQVLSNVLGNAIKASKNGSVVVAELHKTNDFIDMIIKDQGPGIDETKIDLYFKKGYSETGSSGFGLFIAKKIIDSTGGKILVRKTSVGSEFLVSLPAKIEVDELTRHLQ